MLNPSLDIITTTPNINAELGKHTTELTIDTSIPTTNIQMNIEVPNQSLNANILGSQPSLQSELHQTLTLGVKDVLVNGSSVVHNKVASIIIPTKLSQFEDDLDYSRIKVVDSTDLSIIRNKDYLFVKE